MLNICNTKYRSLTAKFMQLHYKCKTQLVIMHCMHINRVNTHAAVVFLQQDLEDSYEPA